MLRRCYRLGWTTVAALVAFTGVGTGAVLLRSWTLVFIAITAVCLAMAAAAALTEQHGTAPGAVPLTLVISTALVGMSGLVMLVEWVAVGIVVALVVAAYPLVGLRGLTTDQLCERWTAGLAGLRAAPSAVAAAAIVRDRQRCLDELERRDPAGVRRCLATPGADPASVLRHRQGSH
ncbi:hypothetical protein [Actinokineospora enzanensis]|uniref:hypothetical protein n=1 Tax=Actinokineospora enzanensis TaxID=155975 RepID=UPI000381EC73|nr:hypothetical protein [Actinokineospora enzanensis]